MTDAALSSLIREVLAEELARLRPAAPAAAPVEERVSIAGDSDLQAFVRRLLALAADPDKRKALEDGRMVFKLAGGSISAASTVSSPAPSRSDRPGAVEVIERGFVSERQVDRMYRDVRRVVLGKAVKLTPLARDRLRQRGIAIERIDQ